MKRQLHMWKMYKYGFTIIELMIVIAMIGIFVAATNTFNWKPQTDIEKANRMKYAISDKFRDENLKIFTGHMPNGDGRISTRTVLTIGTGGIVTTYTDSGWIVFSTGTFQKPFFDGDSKYSIINVSWCTGSIIGSSIWNGTGKVIMTQTGTTFSTGTTGVLSKEPVVLIVEVGYDYRTRKISFDRRTGRISIDN